MTDSFAAAAKPLLGCAMALFATATLADPFETRLLAGRPAADGGIAGLLLEDGPRQLGLDERRSRALPVLDYQWASGWFAGAGLGLGYNLSTRPGLSYGPRITFDRGRSAAGGLRGLGEIDPRPEIGAFVSHAPNRVLQFQASLRYGAGPQRDGMKLNAGARVQLPEFAGLRTSLQAETSWLNRAYTRAWYGVDLAQAAASGLPYFEPGGSARMTTLALELGYRLDEHWLLGARLARQQLEGRLRASPLAEREHDGQFNLSLVRRF